MDTGYKVVGRVAVTLLVAAAMAWALSARAQLRVDPKRGEALAQTWCVNCHVISEDQTGTVSSDAPPFSALTTQDGYDDDKLRAFLRYPHGAMENFDPDEKQINDLIAYIRTQAP